MGEADATHPGGARVGDDPPRASLDEILSFLTHQLQNPVTVIQGLASTLRRSIDVMDEEVVRAAVVAIERSARNLGDLVRSLGEAREVEAGRLPVEARSIELRALLGDVVHDLAPLTEGHPVEIEVEGETVVEGDPVLIRQVVTNLLSNAVKFSPAAAPVRLTMNVRRGCVEVVVEDEGPGAPRGRERELFTMFGRLDSSTKGTGLGLFISRGIARAHGGDLVHEHRAKGGARFRLTLPT